MLVNNDTIFLQYQDIFPGGENSGPRPVLLRYGTLSEEIAGITVEVQALLLKNTDPSRIAIFYPPGDNGILLEQSFTDQNIPFCKIQYIDGLQQPFLRKITQLLFYIDEANNLPGNSDHLLFDILHFDFYQVPAVEIAKLAIEAGKRTTRPEKGMYGLLLEKAKAPARDLFDPGADPHLKALAALLENLFATAEKGNPYTLFGMIIGDATMIGYLGKSPEADWLKDLITALDNFIKNAMIANPGLQLHELVQLIYRMNKERLPLPVSKSSGDMQGVHLTHFPAGIKMDFDHFFLMDLHRLVSENKEELESFFKSLHKISLQPAVSILCVQPGEEIDRWADAQDGIFPDETWSAEIAPLEESIIGPLLSKFVLSVSALNTYLDCPLGFFYKYLLRIPKHTSEAMEFGSAVHYAVEKLFRRLTSENLSGAFIKQERELYITAMLEDFNVYMQNNRAYFSAEAFIRRLQYGDEILTNYYDQYCNDWNTVVSIERNISGVSINGVPIKGKPDKLEFNGRDVTIIDYKTGNIEKALAKLKPPSAADPNGGHYWRQAVFYKLLVDNYAQKDWKVTGAQFDFIEPGKDGLYRREQVHFTPADTETLKQQITQTWTKIRAREFYTGCGEPDCHLCNLVKDNSRSITLQSRETNSGAD